MKKAVTHVQSQAEPQTLKNLKDKLREMFQLDRGDLDFGIYRVMNVKRREVEIFLDTELLPQVQSALAQYQPSDRAELQRQLDEATAQAQNLGVSPDNSPKVKELKAKLAESIDLSKVETEIYSDLYNFFKRYYSEGDFLSLRRYKEGVYALPYEGEEVKLHWANADQYYIKSTENLSNYAFRTAGNQRVRFEVVDANTEQNNNKAEAGKERRFMLLPDKPVVIEDGETVIRFEYKPDPAGRKQDVITAEMTATLLEDKAMAPLARDLEAMAVKADGNRADYTVLEKHLRNFTARNTFDYFIHKDLGGFLRRELDFFIKNEIMHLDDIESESVPRVEQYLSRIKVFRSIAGKIIQFLEQLENFQKKLWLKKKFVLETQYCITLDRIPESFYPEIAANDAQREEWVKLFAIDEITKDRIPMFEEEQHAPNLGGLLGMAADAQPKARKGNKAKQLAYALEKHPKGWYTNPLTVDFLKANPYLVLDTAFFSQDFKERLLAEIESIDEKLDGHMLHSDNFQALNFMQTRYQEAVKCTYTDPPYNTAATEIIYKNGYKHSSWISLMSDRLLVARELSSKDSIISTAIDYAELANLSKLEDQVYGTENRIGIVTVQHNPKGRNQAEFFSENSDYMLVYAKDIKLAAFNNIAIDDNVLATFCSNDADGKFRWEEYIRARKSWSRDNRPNNWYPLYVSPDLRDISSKMVSGYHEVYPRTNTGDYSWKNIRESFDMLNRDGYFKAEKADDGIKIFHKYREQQVLKNVWLDKKYQSEFNGTNILKDLFGKTVFDYPKSVYTVQDILKLTAGKGEYVLDYFAGSGTTGHAVINLMRDNIFEAKYLLVEMGEYFDKVTKPRIQKVVYSKDWKDGKPVARNGISHAFKYLRLESYEDALDNLTLSRDAVKSDLLAHNKPLYEDYMLSYMLDVESKGSTSLLNISQFADPFNYKLRITRNGEVKTVNVDLVETFNWLLGLKVKTMSRVRGVYTVTGENSKGEKVIILWRNTAEIPSEKLDEWFVKQHYSTQDQEFDLIYVNGDNNLENLKRPDETWKVRLIEQDFHQLMFDVRDV